MKREEEKYIFRVVVEVRFEEEDKQQEMIQ